MNPNKPVFNETYRPWIIGLSFFALIYWLSPILMPFVMGALLSYICAPIVAYLHQKNIPRIIATGLVLVALLTGTVTTFLILIPLLSQEINQIYTKLPSLLISIQQSLGPWVAEHLHININSSLNTWIILFQKNSSLAEQVLGNIFISIREESRILIQFLLSLLLVPVVFFYLLKDWPRLIPLWLSWIPNPWRESFRQFSLEVDILLGQYLRGQIVVILLMSSYYSIALVLTGLHSGWLIGIVTGLLVFIPYLGVLTGFILALLSAWTDPSASSLLILWVIVAFSVGHVLESTLITPRLLGERIGLHPVAVILALLSFGQALGFLGVLIALPATAILNIAVKRMMSSSTEKE